MISLLKYLDYRLVRPMKESIDNLAEKYLLSKTYILLYFLTNLGQIELKPFFIEIQNFWASTDKFGR
jgi:hypothetical protein